MKNKLSLHIMDWGKTEEHYDQIVDIIQKMQDDNTHPAFIIGMLELIKSDLIGYDEEGK